MKKLLIASLLFIFLASPVLARSWRNHQPTPPPVPVPPPVSGSLILGAFNANVGTVQVYFDGWSDDPNCAPTGKTTFLYWENYGTSLDSILNGSQDTLIKNFGIKTCPNTILSLFHEANGNWDDWDGFFPGSNNSPAKVVQAYQHIHDIIGSKVKYAWVMNNDSVPNTSLNQPASYYPGDAYVDIVGIDGFNWGGLSFLQAINPNYNIVKTYPKPVWITSYGTSSSGQAAWVADSIVQAKANGIAGLIYFSYDQFKFTSSGLAAFH